ncbi:phosphatase PAP2 family protein [Mucilaginibacter sp. McL0603]|uniref:phosphatase PAP2 family protein n=1 Tax=Mucilaginibacter sp. McL0603 TaxID=3415670 RepID=UPI003CF68403
MKRIIIAVMLFLSASNLIAQSNVQQPETGIYQHFKELSSLPNPSRAWMDTIKFPPAEYGSSILFTLVRPYYLSSEQVQFLSKLTTPPANSSDRVRAELDYLLNLQSTRTAEQVERVKQLGDIGFWPQVAQLLSHPDYQKTLKDLFFEPRSVLGREWAPENLPQSTMLFKGIMQDDRVIEFTIKYKYLRARPYHLEKNLQPLDRINSPSFASGHSLWAYLQAYVWGELIPSKKEQFLRLADEIRQSREVMGIHYPSDNSASRDIAFQMFMIYKKDPKFKIDFEGARTELDKFAKKHNL